MGPLSAIGDTLFPATLRILATSLVITMAAAGNVFAPILFLLIYNIPNYLARWYSLKYGYSMGMEFMVKSQKSGIMDKSILCLYSSWINGNRCYDILYCKH